MVCVWSAGGRPGLLFLFFFLFSLFRPERKEKGRGGKGKREKRRERKRKRKEREKEENNPASSTTQSMSAGGSTGGTDYVWIKLATAKEDVFARVAITSSDLVTDVAERACSKYTHWQLNAGQVRLFMLAKAGPKPQLPASEAHKVLEPLAEEATLESARVDSGAWLVAVPTTPGSSGGGGELRALENPRPSFSHRPLSLSSLSL